MVPHSDRAPRRIGYRAETAPKSAPERLDIGPFAIYNEAMQDQTNIHVRIPQDIAAGLRVVAAKSRRSLTSEIAVALEAWVRWHQRQADERSELKRAEQKNA